MKRIIFLWCLYFSISCNGATLYFWNDSTIPVTITLKRETTIRHSTVDTSYTTTVKPGEKIKFISPEVAGDRRCWREGWLYYKWTYKNKEHTTRFSVLDDGRTCHTHHAAFYHLGGGHYKILHGSKAHDYFKKHGITDLDKQFTTDNGDEKLTDGKEKYQ